MIPLTPVTPVTSCLAKIAVCATSRQRNCVYPMLSQGNDNVLPDINTAQCQVPSDGVSLTVSSTSDLATPLHPAPRSPPPPVTGDNQWSVPGWSSLKHQKTSQIPGEPHYRDIIRHCNTIITLNYPSSSPVRCPYLLLFGTVQNVRFCFDESNSRFFMLDTW